MKIIDALKEKGYPFNIPDCSRNELPLFLKEMGFNVGAEIGVYRGVYTQKFCQAGLKMYAIDPWIGYLGAGRSEKKQDMQETNYEYAKERLSPYKNCTLVRKTSMDALDDFNSESLDFVYIDGDHRFRFVAEDIAEWFFKVKKGGIIAGHDYFSTHPGASNVICHVKPVVDAFLKTYGIKNFYTFGQPKSQEVVDKNDKVLSWMFVKP